MSAHPPKLLVYGSGDRGTALLRQLCCNKGVGLHVRDIRHSAEDLTFMNAQRPERRAVPCVFREDGTHWPTEECLSALYAMPDLTFGPRTA